MIRVAIAFSLLLTIKFLGAGSESQVLAPSNQLGTPAEVIVAVAPAYPPVAVSASLSEDVIVDAQIDREGLVLSARMVEGSKLFKMYSGQAAKRWRFAAVSNVSGLRQVRITFAFKIVPKKTPMNARTPIFRFPSRVEVFHTPSEDTPLPARKSRPINPKR